ncbi:hypothetical protein COLO4_35475 [Corchorus olitorius]|uniref:Uncharacterized protein n=1 Tax=Corchorus olitorius TaxID=93759 RepID=A0A1R3GGL3_9ROSI|nr:hypothetical protein COLO4_35475 [Corchorus olitorius]
MNSGVSRIGDPTAGILFRKILFFVMDKIGIEHVDNSDSKQAISTVSKVVPELASNPDVAEARYTVKQQLEALQTENVLLKRAVVDLRREISAEQFGDLNSGKYREMGLVNPKQREKNNEKKSMEGDVNKELKKALKRAGRA